MKQVVAIVKPFLAEKVLEGLKRSPLEAVSVREVKGPGQVLLGQPPIDAAEDWVVLVRK